MIRALRSPGQHRRFVVIVALFVAAGGIGAGIVTSLGGNSPSIPSSIVVHRGTVVVAGKTMTVFVDQDDHVLFYNRIDTPYLLACKKPRCSLDGMIPVQVSPTGSVRGIDVTPTPAAAGIAGKCYVEYWGHPIYYDPKYRSGDVVTGFPSQYWKILTPGVPPFSYESLGIPDTPQYHCPA